MPRGALKTGSSATENVAQGLRLQLLGGASWSRGTERSASLERRDAGMLAYLAIEGRTQRARLLDLLWPDAERDVARNHLRQRLHRLKRAVGGELVEGTEMLELAASISVDARDSPPEQAAGELLPGYDYDDCPQFEAWLSRQRSRLRRSHFDALDAKAAQLESEGRLAEAIAAAQRLVAFAPIEEHAHRRLMHLHYVRGDRGAALAAFETCERILKDELGAKPSAETLALLAMIEQVASAPLARPATSSSLIRPPRTIGRDDELAALNAAWNAGRAVLLLAAAGLGKSRLLDEAAAQLDRRVLVRARPGDTNAPYAVLARWLRAIDEIDPNALGAARADVLAALLPERSMPAVTVGVTTGAVRIACERVLASAHANGLRACFVDDVHFCDAASLDIIEQLMLGDSLDRCHWALAGRPSDDGGPTERLASVLTDANRVVTLRLAPLQPQAIADLVDSLALPGVAGEPLAGPLARHTGGNPLFVLETLKQALAEGRFDGRHLPRPLGVVQSIQSRLGRLSAQAQSVVQIAAVAGGDFSVALAESVLGTTAFHLSSAWRELEAAQLIDRDAFVHDLVHEAVLDWVPHPIRRHLSAAVARFAAQAHADPARIADLWLAAGDDAHAAPALVEAAVAARRTGRFVEAAQRSEQAARAYDRLADDSLAFEQLYRAFDDLSTHAPREDLAGIVAEMSQRARTHAQRAMEALARAQLASLAGDWSAMEEALREALVQAERAHDRALEAEARFGLGVLLHYRGELTESVDAIGAAVRLLDTLGTAVRQAEMRGSLARLLYLAGRVAEASGELDRAIPVLRDANVANELAADTGFRALLALEVGDTAAALELSERSSQLVEDAEAASHEWLTLMGDRLRVLVTTSRYAEALDLVRAVRADARFEPMPSQARVIELEAALMFELGRGWHGERLLEPLASIDRGVVGYRGSRALVALQGRMLSVRGMDAASAAGMRDLLSGVPQRCRYAALAAPLLPAGEALALCTSALELADGLGLKAHLPGLLASRAEALCRMDQREEAARCARRGVRLLETTTPLVYRGGIWLLLHGTLAALGDAAAAREVLLQASEWLHRTARRDVPAPFRDSFLGRNAVNRELLVLAIRADIAPAIGSA